MSLLYAVFALLGSPYILWKLATSPKFRSGLREKWGIRRRREGEASCVWIHAVSVGEVAAAKPVVDELRRILPGHAFAISVATPEGRARAAALFQSDFVFYAPYDFIWSVRRAYDAIRPAAIVCMEFELWPNLWREAIRRGIPIVVSNGRMTERALSRVRCTMKFPCGTAMTHLRMGYATIVAQTEEYAARFRALGSKPERVSVAGNVKWDIPAGDPTRLPDAVRAIAAGGPLLVAGSTREGEEEIVARSFAEVRRALPAARLAFAPRHAERDPAAVEALGREGLSFVRLSEIRGAGAGSPTPGAPVLLVDTVGDLAAIYALAAAAFVGGSLVSVGGQNPLEPAAAGVPVLFGPSMENFKAEAQRLLEAGAARTVEAEGVRSLAGAWKDLLADGAKRAAMGAAGRTLVEKNRGAARRNAEAIARALGGDVSG